MTRQESRICFIGGSGRSGTTVLRRMFSRHPDVAGIPEFRITLDPGGLIDFFLTLSHQWSPWLFDAKVKELRKTLLSARRSNPLAKYYRYGLRKTGLAFRGYKLEAKYTDIGIERYCGNYAERVENLFDQLTEFRYKGSWTGQPLGEKNELYFSPMLSRERLGGILGSFYRDLISCICAEAGKSHFVEDNTWNMIYWAGLLELVPEGRLVHIYRDPRDVVASLTKQWWGPGDPVRAARFYAALIERWEQVKKLVPAETFMETGLERLVESPKSILGEIAEFWGLDWDESLLSIDLGKAHSGRWKKDIPEEIYPEVREILIPFIKRYGYDE